MNNKHQFGSASEAIGYPILLLAVLWIVFWADHLFPAVDFYKFGIMPGEMNSLKGIIFMPLLHSKNEMEHIVNNSVPTLILLGTIIYYYRAIALRVFLISWLLTGFGVWFFAQNTHSFHIGISGLVYAMVGFLFTSGLIRKHRPLQAISLFVAFIYGSLIWGIFPIKEQMSWEGHLSGLIVGVALAFVYRKAGPQSPKYMYEIEKELGIEPPDFEGQWNEKVRLEKERQEEIEKQKAEIHYRYHYTDKKGKDSTKNENDQ